MVKQWMVFTILTVFTILVLLMVFSTVALAEGKIVYWANTDSELPPNQIVAWLKNQPSNLVHTWLEDTTTDTVIRVCVFDIKAPLNNTLHIKTVRILLYRAYQKIKTPFILDGYTIQYLSKACLAYRYHAKENKYMKYDYIQQKFEHEKQKLPTIPMDDKIAV